MSTQTVQYVHGIKANLGQFSQQLLQVFFVGLTIGLQRNVIPALAEQEFGVPAGFLALLTAFIVSFGFVNGDLNFVAGRLSDRLGRRKLLLWGWIAALPIPFMILCAILGLDRRRQRASRGQPGLCLVHDRHQQDRYHASRRARFGDRVQ